MVVVEKPSGQSASIASSAEASKTVPDNLSKSPQPLPATNNIETGNWIDLLALVDPSKHGIVGHWERRGDSLVGLTYTDRRFMVPYAVDGSYKISMEFTRPTGKHAVTLKLPVGDTAVELVTSFWGGQYNGLFLIDETKIYRRSDISSGLKKNVSIINGKRYRLDVDVKVAGANASIVSTLDGDPLVSWSGDYSRLSSSALFAMPSLRTPGVIVHDSRTQVHKLQLMLIGNGQGKKLGDDWGYPFREVAAGPPREVANECVNWGNKWYYFSDEPMNLFAAKRLAQRVRGRLITISSADERAVFSQMRNGRNLWTSGWRSHDIDVWRDERGRPLRYVEGWVSGEPNNVNGTERLMCYGLPKNAPGPPGLMDLAGHKDSISPYACIEWGEEYPEEATVLGAEKSAFKVPETKDYDIEKRNFVDPAVGGNPQILFDGTSLDKWRGYKTEKIGRGWSIQDGLLLFDGSEKANICTKEEFEDFEMTFQWKSSYGGNSGVMYRVQLGLEKPHFSGPEYAIAARAGDPGQNDSKQHAGAMFGLYGNGRLNAKGDGFWNTSRIVHRGNLVEHWLNGKLMVDADIGSDDWNSRVAATEPFSTLPQFAQKPRGHIVLQGLRNKIWFKDIVIKDLAQKASANTEEQPAASYVNDSKESQGLLGVNLIKNGSCEKPTANGEVPDWRVIEGKWAARQEDPKPFGGGAYFYAAKTNFAKLSQQVDIRSISTDTDASRVFFLLDGVTRTWRDQILIHRKLT